MKTLIYINKASTAANLEEMLNYIQTKQINEKIDFLKVDAFFDTYWDQNHSIINEGDTIIFNDITHFSKSLGSILDYINNLLQLNVHIHFVKYNLSLESSTFNFNTITQLLQAASSKEDIIIHPYSSSGRQYKTPGRPKGSRNRSLKLDIFKNEIQKYLAEGHTYATISKLVNCHPMTLKGWLNERQELLDSGS